MKSNKDILFILWLHVDKIIELNDINIKLQTTMLYDATRIWSFNSDKSFYIILDSNNNFIVQHNGTCFITSIDNPNMMEAVDDYMVSVVKKEYPPVKIKKQEGYQNNQSPTPKAKQAKKTNQE